MEQQLKQRLIGAGVLVALAVIVLPMLLDGPDPQATPATAIPLDIPASPEAPLQTRDIPLRLPAPAAAPTAAADDPNRIVTVDADANPTPRLHPEDDAPAAAPATPAPAAPSSTAAATSTQRPAPSAAPAPAAALPAAPVATAPASAVPPAATPPSAASGRFVVNLGSFGNLANAQALQQRLRQRGVAVLAEAINVDGKPAQRLRAGPYATRAEAESAALTIGRQEPGNRFSVGELESAAPLTQPAASKVPAGFAVQLGALKVEAEANTLRDRLRGAGFSAYVERAQTDAGTLWRVRVGPELQRERADAARQQIRQKLQLDGIVVPHP